MGFVKKAIKSVVKAVVKVVKSVVKAIVNVVSSVINFVTQPFMGMLGGMPDVPSAAAEADRQQGVLIQREGSNISIPVVYGYRKVGAVLTFAETGSTKNKYLYCAYVLSEGCIEGVREVFIDDWQLPANLTADLNAGTLVNVNADRYNGRVQMQFFPGTFFNNPSDTTIGTTLKNGMFAESPSWTTDMHYNGLAVIFARYEWKDINTQEDSDNNPFTGNIPELQASILGVKIASLTVSNPDLTDYNIAPRRYSTNPAEILLDYLRNPRYGKGLQNSDIHWDTWKKSAVKCNQTVTYLTGSGISGPILTCNAVVDTAQTIFANVKILLMGFRAYMPYVQGKYKLKIEDAGNETDILSGAAVIAQTFTKNDIIGNVTYTGIEKSSKYNAVTISYVDPDQKFSVQQVIYPETEEERQVYINLDGGRENKLEATFPTITNYAIAKDFARLLFNKSRRQETCSITVSSKALELEPGDCIRIQSNILNFSTDPWRIVSFKLNDDMSIDLGCVRNPDDIYPYVSVGEEDIVLPTYVPRGSSIYYPETQALPPVGLVPPTNAVYPGNYVPNNVNPGPTNPNNNQGGGVGGGGSTENNAPTNPAPASNFSAVLTLKRSSYTDFGNGSYNFNLVFIQPAGLYQRSTLWFRADSQSPYQEQAITSLPGEGGEIFVTVGPLPKGIYTFYIRSYSTDGRASNIVLKGQFGYTDLLASDPGFSGFIRIETNQVIPGWIVGEVVEIAQPGYDNVIDSIRISPVVNLSNPVRKLQVAMQQVKNIISTPVNRYIKGVRIFYKFYDDDYWSWEDLEFESTYVPGSTVTWTMAAEFGNLEYPTNITAGSIEDILQQYDFIARLTYNDGSLGTNILGPDTGPVEIYLGQRAYTIWGTDGNPASVVTNNPLPPAWSETFKTTEQNPNANYSSALLIIPNVRSVYLTATNVFSINFNLPSGFTKFRGYRIRYRTIKIGASTEYQTIDTGYVPTGQDPGGGFFLDMRIPVGTLSGADSAVVYVDFAVTALVSTAGGIVEADKSIVSRANIINLTAQGFNNLYDTMAWTVKTTPEAIEELRVIWAGNVVVNPKAWVKKTLALTSNQAPDFEYFNGQYYLNRYYKFRFQMPDTADALVVYRRYYNPNYLKDYSGIPKYQRIGPWEKVRIPIGDLTLDSQGWYNVNLRGSIHFQYFDGNNPTPGFVDTAYGPSGQWPSPTAPNKIAGIVPYFGVSSAIENTSAGKVEFEWTQFLMVVEDIGIEGPSGLLLKSFYDNNDQINSSTVITPDVDGFTVGNVRRDQIVADISIFNSVANGYGRKLSEAIAAPNIDKLTWYTQIAKILELSSSPPARANFASAYSLRCNQPRNGDIVY